MRTMILASASPRRREILDLMGVTYTVIPAKAELPMDCTLTIEQAVLNVARAKAEEVADAHPDTVIVGADTIVVVDDTVLGKPKDEGDAIAMLRRLSGREHRVITAVWICDGERSEGFADSAAVTFVPMSEDEIKAYVATAEPMDKAGAYAIQGRGMRYVHSINGDFYTVMGLPSARLYEKLKKHLS